MEARRILVYGVTGSGKTHLAARLSERTGIPWHSVDDLTWMPNWQMVPDEEQAAKIETICRQDEWILDTAYAKWLELPLERVELIVCLDYPRWVSFARLLSRTLARAIDGAPVCNGNRETLRQMFSRDSILAWHFKSFARKRRRIRQWVESGRPVIHLASPHATDTWLSLLTP
ncbi:MAG: adenylate kinase [Armatimonadota bacterium]|nr:adenylate kinase [Armatimonadota bacterium]